MREAGLSENGLNHRSVAPAQFEVIEHVISLIEGRQTNRNSEVMSIINFSYSTRRPFKRERKRPNSSRMPGKKWAVLENNLDKDLDRSSRNQKAMVKDMYLWRLPNAPISKGQVKKAIR